MEIKYVHQSIKPLTRATDGSGAWDLRSAEETFELPPFGETVIHTGVAIWLRSAGKLGLVAIRSGISDTLALRNGVGFIDSDYQGEIMAALVNRTAEPFLITFNDRILQIAIALISPPEYWRIKTVTEFSAITGRGTSGYGHSGAK